MSLYKPKAASLEVCSYSRMAYVDNMRIPCNSAKEAGPVGVFDVV